MYYKVVERFGPDAGDKWQSYLEWRSLDLTSFESVDGILRPDLFEPETNDDWQNCVNADFKLNLITGLAYARTILTRYENATLVGVEIEVEAGYAPQDGLLGFDIIDGYCNVSLITNWGTDEADDFSEHIMANGLIGDQTRALQVRDSLRKNFPEDSHAQACQVWAIYRVDP